MDYNGHVHFFPWGGAAGLLFSKAEAEYIPRARYPVPVCIYTRDMHANQHFEKFARCSNVQDSVLHHSLKLETNQPCINTEQINDGHRAAMKMNALKQRATTYDFTNIILRGKKKSQTQRGYMV